MSEHLSNSTASSQKVEIREGVGSVAHIPGFHCGASMAGTYRVPESCSLSFQLKSSSLSCITTQLPGLDSTVGRGHAWAAWGISLFLELMKGFQK